MWKLDILPVYIRGYHRYSVFLISLTSLFDWTKVLVYK